METELYLNRSREPECSPQPFTLCWGTTALLSLLDDKMKKSFSFSVAAHLRYVSRGTMGPGSMHTIRKPLRSLVLFSHPLRCTSEIMYDFSKATQELHPFQNLDQLQTLRPPHRHHSPTCVCTFFCIQVPVPQLTEEERSQFETPIEDLHSTSLLYPE